MQGLTSDDVNRVMPLVQPLLTVCQLGDQGEQIQVSNCLRLLYKLNGSGAAVEH